MHRIKTNIPNAITCANLFCGCMGIVVCFQNSLLYGAYAIVLAGALDFLDGLAARVLHAHTPIGKELDSLADVVSFGLLPAAIIYQLFLHAPQIAHISTWLNYLAFLIPVFSALRLAKFNLDARQEEMFIGLPTPANALLIASFPLILNEGHPFYRDYILNPFFLSFFVLTMCLLLVAELPLMSLKFKNAALSQNVYRYLLIVLSAILAVIFKFAAVPIIIMLYIALSVIQFKFANL